MTGMQTDARYTMLGAFGIGVVMVTVGLACSCQVVTNTGFGLWGAGMLVAGVFEKVLPEDATPTLLAICSAYVWYGP